MIFHRDYETRSTVDLKKTGAHVYMRHPTTSIWCASYAVDADPVKVWLPGQPVPAEFTAAANDPEAEVWAHNAAFEQSVEQFIGGPRHGLPVFALAKQRCTMVTGYALSLPGSLEMAAPAVGIKQGKDMIGGRLMLQLAKPRGKIEYASGYDAIPFDAVRVAEMNAEGWETYEHMGRKCARVRWWNDPEKLAKLYAYCQQDTVVEREYHHRLRPLKKSELDLWHLDQVINQRGVFIDRKLCEAAKTIIAAAEDDLDAQMKTVSNKEIGACSNRNQVLAYVRDRGLLIDGLAKDVLEDVYEEGIDAVIACFEAEQPDSALEWVGTTEDRARAVKRVLDLWRLAARASVAKIETLVRGADWQDQRVRGLLQFHAASTGRWGGRRFQPQNLKRPEELDIEAVIDAVATGDYEWLSMLYADPLSAVSDILRGLICAEPGKKIVAADYSNIEGRVLAWLAGEDWKLQAFRDFDNGVGHDLYKITAGGILGKNPKDVTKDERQSHGKVPELACIAEGQLVLTDHGLIPIERVELFHKVWDGVGYQGHDGVAYRGEKEVFEYDGLTATADHIVWIEGQTRPVRFGHAAASGQRLLRSGLGRKRIWVGEDHTSGATLPQRLARRLRGRGVQGLWNDGLDSFGGVSSRHFERVPSVLAATCVSQMAGPTAHSGEGPLREPGCRGVSALWRAWHSVRVLFDPGSGPLGYGEFGLAEGSGNRSDRQRRALRTGQSEMVNEVRTKLQQANDQKLDGRRNLGRDDEPVFEVHDHAIPTRGVLTRAGDLFRLGRRRRSTKELDGHLVETRKARVYDILHAGPRNRFTVSDCLVHNCGYQGAIGAFKQMATAYNVNLTDERITEIVQGWRAKHPMIKQFWYDMEKAAMAAVREKGSTHHVGKITFRMAGSFLFMRLPSGRFLSYPNAEIRSVKTKWVDDETGEPIWKDALTYFSTIDPAKKGKIVRDDHNSATWARISTYGGMLVENATQAVARDILADAMPRLEAAGYPTILTVHDEIVSEPDANHGSAAEMEEIMCDLPAWARGCPVSAEGFEGLRYRK